MSHHADLNPSRSYWVDLDTYTALKNQGPGWYLILQTKKGVAQKNLPTPLKDDRSLNFFSYLQG